METMVSPGWSWKNEYRLAFYGSETLPDVLNVGAVTIDNVKNEPIVQTISTELVYRF